MTLWCFMPFCPQIPLITCHDLGKYHVLPANHRPRSTSGRSQIKFWHFQKLCQKHNFILGNFCTLTINLSVPAGTVAFHSWFQLGLAGFPVDFLVRKTSSTPWIKQHQGSDHPLPGANPTSKLHSGEFRQICYWTTRQERPPRNAGLRLLPQTCWPQ